MKFTKASIRPGFGFVYKSDDGNAKKKLHTPTQRRAIPDLRCECCDTRGQGMWFATE